MGEAGEAGGVCGDKTGDGAEQRGLYHQAQGGHGIIHAQKQYEGNAAQKAIGFQGTFKNEEPYESHKAMQR